MTGATSAEKSALGQSKKYNETLTGIVRRRVAELISAPGRSPDTEMSTRHCSSSFEQKFLLQFSGRTASVDNIEEGAWVIAVSHEDLGGIVFWRVLYMYVSCVKEESVIEV